MTNINAIIKLVQNKSITNTYVTFLKSCRQDITTRRREELNTVSCRLWQLQYCLFTIIYNINNNLYKDPKFLYILCDIYFKMLTTESWLYNFIAHNRLPPYYLTLCYNADEQTFKEYIESTTHSYLCMYGINNITNLIDDNSVVHYFTIIKSGDDYFLTSSYGSQYICIPYSINKLDSINEFYEFCENLHFKLQSRTRSRSQLQLQSQSQSQYVNILLDEKLSNFMKKYFLSILNIRQKRYDDDDIDINKKLRHQYIPPNVGIKRELDYLLNNQIFNFDIAIITDYENYVEKTLLENKILEPYLKSEGKKVKRVKYNKSKKHKAKKHKAKSLKM